jgi:hypothetical protein
LQHGELMPERENFRCEFEPGADRGSKRDQQGDEQGSHPARESYQALAHNRNGHNTFRIFSRHRPVLGHYGITQCNARLTPTPMRSGLFDRSKRSVSIVLLGERHFRKTVAEFVAH